MSSESKSRDTHAPSADRAASDAQLFRAEVSDTSVASGYGVVIPFRGRAFDVAVVTCVAVTIGLLALAMVLDYTPRRTVPGALVVQGGLGKARSPGAGTVMQILRREGEMVLRGARLMVLESDVVDADGNGVRRQALQELQVRRDALVRGKALDLEIAVRDRIAATARLKALNVKRTALDRKAEALRLELDAAREELDRARVLRGRGFLSDTDVRVVDRRHRAVEVELAEALADRAQIGAELVMVSADADRSGLQESRVREETTIAVSDIDREILEARVTRSFYIVAESSGLLSGLMVSEGQSVDRGDVVATIVPSAARLSAHLLIPSEAIGNVRVGQRVVIRYSAFPVQQYGVAHGSIVLISGAPVSGDLWKGTEYSRGEPVYRAVVRLDKQVIERPGAPPISLPVGATLEGDLLDEPRPLWRWLAAPALSIQGRL